MPDYNDPFEQTGPVPIFDMAEVRRRRERASDPHALTTPTYPDGTATREHVEDRLDVAAIQAAGCRETADELWRVFLRLPATPSPLGDYLQRRVAEFRDRADRLAEADPPT